MTQQPQTQNRRQGDPDRDQPLRPRLGASVSRFASFAAHTKSRTMGTRAHGRLVATSRGAASSSTVADALSTLAAPMTESPPAAARFAARAPVDTAEASAESISSARPPGASAYSTET